eukprot:g799.t1
MKTKMFAIVLMICLARGLPQIELTESEIATGMVDTHRIALQKMMKEKGMAMLVRPSDPTSTKLVKAKSYATKGLDIHDKSSNWGPQAGFVPVDPFFNKRTGDPKNGDNNLPNPAAEPHLHTITAVTYDTRLGAVDLYLNDAVKADFLENGGSNGPPETDVEGGTGSFAGLKVWSYSGRPITGDMDVWAIYPRVNSVDRLYESSIRKLGRGLPLSFPGLNEDNYMKAGQHGGTHSDRDSFSYVLTNYEKSVAGGLSTATDFEYRSIDLVNAAILNKDNEGVQGWPREGVTAFNRAALNSDVVTTRPIMNHGVESKNFFFAQQLDDKLVLVHGNGYRVLEGQEAIGVALVALASHGYLISFNVRYLMEDARLNGLTLAQHREKLVKSGKTEDEADDAIKGIMTQMRHLRVLATKVRCAVIEGDSALGSSEDASDCSVKFDGPSEKWYNTKLRAHLGAIVSLLYQYHETVNVHVSDKIQEVEADIKRSKSHGGIKKSFRKGSMAMQQGLEQSLRERMTDSEAAIRDLDSPGCYCHGGAMWSSKRSLGSRLVRHLGDRMTADETEKAVYNPFVQTQSMRELLLDFVVPELKASFTYHEGTKSFVMARPGQDLRGLVTCIMRHWRFMLQAKIPEEECSPPEIEDVDAHLSRSFADNGPLQLKSGERRKVIGNSGGVSVLRRIQRAEPMQKQEPTQEPTQHAPPPTTSPAWQRKI